MPASSLNQEWYAAGLHFSCTQCGNCCTGPPGAVWFNKEEGRAMAAKLGLDETEFYRRYAHRLDVDPIDNGGWSLEETKTEHGFDCIFLDRTTIPGKAICSIYDARPTQCRTWPFWPENLKTSRHWESVRRRTPCPGMGPASEVTSGTPMKSAAGLVRIEQIRIQRDRNPSSD